jgi:hypothetical protein
LISETAFAQSHSSTWRTLAPTTDLFVRKINLQLRQRVYKPLKSMVAPTRRAFVNEIGFDIFSKAITNRRKRNLFEQAFVNVFEEAFVADAISSARTTICRIERIRQEDVPEPNEEERLDYLNQSDRLYSFFRKISIGAEIEISPRFVGCGIIDTCFGDVYFDETLFEVKAGDRSFRSVDIRQLLTYAALNKAASARHLNKLGLFNPRTGISCTFGLDELCLEVAGRPSEELLMEIIRVISSGDISR